jgi:2-dehydropantoate 2-reductase
MRPFYRIRAARGGPRVVGHVDDALHRVRWRVMRVLVVGAGAVGVVYADALQRAGVEVSYLVRPHRLEEARAGVTLTRVGLLGGRRSARVAPAAVLTEWADVRARAFDEVWLALPADAIDEALLAALAEARGEACVVLLAPGAELVRALRAHVPDARLVRGSIAFLSWHAPLQGSREVRERATPEGYACLVPPGRGAAFAGPRAAEIVARLRRGGLPAHVDARADLALSLDTAVLMPVVLALEACGWSFATLARSDALGLAVRAARQALAILTGRGVPLRERLLVRPVLLRVVLRLAPRLAPLDLEAFFRAHFSKVRPQSILLIGQIVARGAAADAPREALEELVARAEAAHCRSTPTV